MSKIVFLYFIAFVIGVFIIRSASENKAFTKNNFIASVFFILFVGWARISDPSPVTLLNVGVYVIALLVCLAIIRLTIKLGYFSLSALFLVIILGALIGVGHSGITLPWSISIVIQPSSSTQAPSTPVSASPTTSPSPAVESQVSVALISSLGAVIVALIGLIGVIITSYATIQSARIAAKKKE